MLENVARRNWRGLLPFSPWKLLPLCALAVACTNIDTEDQASDAQWLATGLSHGAELTRAMVGPEGLGVSTSQLRKVNVNISTDRFTSWPGTKLPPWVPNAPYVYNNDPNNHGGVVPAGGMKIDGFDIPGGTVVVQFDDFGAQGLIVSGDSNGASPAYPGVVFRGCRWRGSIDAPGFINVYGGSHTKLWMFHNDAGGLGPADSQYNTVSFQITDRTTNSIFYRNYVSYTATGLLLNSHAPQVIENFVEKLTLFFGDFGPPGESGPYHLNGIKFHGGHDNVLALRNRVILQSPDEAGHTIAQTEAIGFWQYVGDLAPGTGTNLDGSVGYQVKDNFVAGGGYSFYGGQNPGTAASTVRNMVFSGNRVSTQYWPTGGAYGPLAAAPAFGSNGNAAVNNTWADGPNAGKLAFGSAGTVPPTNPPPTPTAQTLFTTQVPATTTNSDGASVNYELGMRFTSTAAGKITAIRFYKSPSERNTHVGRLFAGGQQLAAVTFASETASGWQEQALSTPVSIAANTEYTVSVNTGASYYVATVSGLATQVSNGSLRSVVGNNGVFGPVGSRPTQSWQNTNYFRDVVFVPGTTTSPTTPGPSADCAKGGAYLWSNLEACGFPGPGNTGVPAGLSLKATAGRTITVDNTVIDGERITGGLTIAAKNVTVRNSAIASSFATGEAANGTGVIKILAGASATIDHCDLDGQSRTHSGIWYEGASLVARANDIRNTNDGIFAWDSGGFTIEDNYLHDFTTATANGHIDGFQTEGASNGVIRHNTYDINSGQTAAIGLWDGRRNTDNILVENNLIAGGGFSIYAEDYSATFSLTNVRHVNNKFSTKRYPCVGLYGVWYVRGAPTDGWRRTGNVVLETGQNIDNQNPIVNGTECR